MTLGLVFTAVIAYTVAGSPSLIRFIFGNMIVFYGLIIAELALVFIISSRITKLAPSTAAGLFLLYSALNGATLSMVLLVYTGQSVANAFFACAAMFAAMSVYGATTKRDLSGWGSFLFMGLIGIIIASLINIFIGSAMMEFVISGIGILVFTGLTAYDTARIKEMSLTVGQQGEFAAKRVKVYGALTLHLDFINLFLMLLRFFGGGRD
jgi:FtsH-binding integral membrane protein